MCNIEERTLALTPEWLRKNCLPGARCAECKTRFKKKRSNAGIACLRNSVGGNSWYALCERCSINFKARGDAGIPNCRANAGPAVLKSASISHCGGRCKSAFSPENPAIAIAITPKGDCLLCDGCYRRWKTCTMPDLSFTLLADTKLQPCD
jgi:hypothetical protein